MGFHSEKAGLVFHRSCGKEKSYFVENFGENVERYREYYILSCRIYIGDDSFYRFRVGMVVFHLVLYFGDAVESGGVVPPAEELACFVQGEAGHASDQVHSDLPGV